MPRYRSLPAGSTGQLAFGPADEDRIVTRTLEFIRQQLPTWRDDPRRPRQVAEKSLNSSLCDFLDVTARTHLPMARFKHEAPQTAGRTADIGVHGLDEATTVGAWSYGIYEPFLVVECKRLPSPDGKVREREYVSGFHANGSPTGGIQRFKLGLHGRQVEVAAIVGYIEKYCAQDWHGEINQWLADLVRNRRIDGATWSSSESLQELMADAENTAWCDSEHSRIGDCITPDIRLRHIWITIR